MLNVIALALVMLHPNDTISMCDKVWNINEVVVTGTRTEKRLSKTPVLTTLIRSDEIVKAAATSVLETLQDNIPGIVVSANAMGNNMRIKGLNSRYILVLVDGERLVSEGAGGNINLSQINVNDIEHIEMVNGAASALYGSNAVGAVINIITKKTANPLDVGANASFGSHASWFRQVSLSSKINKLRLKGNLFSNSSDGFGSDGNGAYAARYSDKGGTVWSEFEIQPSLFARFSARYYRHETFNPQSSMDVEHPLNRKITFCGSVEHVFAESRHRIRFSGNWDRFLDDRVMEKKDNRKDRQNMADNISVRLTDTYKVCSGLESVGGLEYNKERNYAIKTLGSDPVTKHIYDYNLFDQLEWKISNQWTFVGGVRYTYNSQFHSAFSPKIACMYSVGNYKFRASMGTAFRSPDIKELYYNFDHQGMFWVYGNPDLKAEKGWYNSLSAEYTKGFFNASLSAYINCIFDKITQYDKINAQGADGKYYKNVNSVTLKGFDVNCSWLLFNKLLLKATYSYCNARDNATGLQLDSNVMHSSTVSLTWNDRFFSNPFSLMLSSRYNSPILYQSSDLNSDNTEKVIKLQSKPYSIWKVVVRQSVTIHKHSFSITLKCDNLFNFKDTSFIDPGRQYLVGLQYLFNI